ncbi:MAG: hypothetical protein M1829_003238 [Trizodia sp. TS-e1964]|nr:MAG: hypothetical protein M1829_003238 [Trizodia sp. TS-e1964]
MARVINDDGPPSTQSSPYVHSLVLALQSAHHTVSVVLPHTQRSWIGKAHIANQIIKPTYYRPGTLHHDDGTTYSKPTTRPDDDEWILVDGTPASCAQIGIHHLFAAKGPVDLVVSGPNYGRNTTAVFALSSGTLGGAFEAAVCGKKSIALSYAYSPLSHDAAIIASATQVSVKVIEYLAANWSAEVDVYSVNVPLVPEVATAKLLWTHILPNHWTSGSCFQEVDAADEMERAEQAEMEIREGEGGAGEGLPAARHRHTHFKFTPRFSDVRESVEKSEPGNDGWAVTEGHTSITPLKANFMHATGFSGELRL